MDRQLMDTMVEIGAKRVQVKISVSPAIAAAFKAKCKADKVSMASTLSGFMATFAGINTHAARNTKDLLSSRGGRRKRVAALTQELTEIKDHEETYKESIPENLTSSLRYENAEESIQILEEAIESLVGAYRN